MAADPLAVGLRLLEERESLRTVLGEDRYEEMIAPLRRMLRDIATRRGVSVLEVAIRAAKDLDEQGRNPIALLAAAADELEEGP